MANALAATGVSRLFETVVDGDYCVGCGACAAVPGSPIRITMDGIGRLQASLASDAEAAQVANDVLAVCPFADQGPDEDELAADLFPEATPHSEIGRHLSAYAGHVAVDGFRARGSSGGMGSWILTELLRRGMVDAVLHVKEGGEGEDRLFGYGVSASEDDVMAGAKSRYYPVEMSGVLRHVRENPGRYAIVGIPCFVKAIRRLAAEDPVIAERIEFVVGIICGHLKTARFADFLAWQLGIEPGGLRNIDFRHKFPDRPASHYGVRVTGEDAGGTVTATGGRTELYGQDWGHGLFKYAACDYCDDVFGETADITVGDAWLPDYVNDPQGTNVVVTREARVARLVEDGIARGELSMDSLTADRTARSQASGLRHRREGLAVRLAGKDRQREWRPPKRTGPDDLAADPRYRRIYQLRLALSKASHRAYARAIRDRDVAAVERGLQPLVDQYRDVYQRATVSPARRGRRARRAVRRLARRMSIR